MQGIRHPSLTQHAACQIQSTPSMAATECGFVCDPQTRLKTPADMHLPCLHSTSLPVQEPFRESTRQSQGMHTKEQTGAKTV